MDRRQLKTRRAIFAAFTDLLKRKEYEKITIQDIIDAADVGRSTFYAHFETKDELLHSICGDLLLHLKEAVHDGAHTHGLRVNTEKPLSVFCHSLRHLQENDHNILRLLACDSNKIFLGYFSEIVREIVRIQLPLAEIAERRGVPEEYLCHHITQSYISLVAWWLQKHPELEAQQLDKYFRAVIEPLWEGS